MPITHVSCGKYHTAALSADGDVYAWGLESSGQLGLGSSRTKAPTPQKVDALSGRGITQLSCGLYHTAALTADGEVLTCGFGGSFFNGAGALGHGDRAQLEEPKVVAAFGPSSTSGLRAASVSSGGYHSIALDVDGGVWSWGRGEWGRTLRRRARQPPRLPAAALAGRRICMLAPPPRPVRHPMAHGAFRSRASPLPGAARRPWPCMRALPVPASPRRRARPLSPPPPSSSVPAERGPCARCTRLTRRRRAATYAHAQASVTAMQPTAWSRHASRSATTWPRRCASPSQATHTLAASRPMAWRTPGGVTSTGSSATRSWASSTLASLSMRSRSRWPCR